MLLGAEFKTNKCFLLPSAVPDLPSLIALYERNRGAALLIVGHTDTSGEDAFNETLSLERADSLSAYLRDDVDAWLAWYDSGSDSKRWGAYEDSLMIGSLASRGLVVSSDPILTYQRWHNALPPDQQAPNWEPLAEDGVTGPRTRRQLVGDYLRHDRTSLPPDVSVTTHGCGEYFPLDPTLEEVGEAPGDGERDVTDRRVEVFCFDGKLGVQPPAKGKISKRGSAEYPEWRTRARMAALRAATRSPNLHVSLKLVDLQNSEPVALREYALHVGGGRIAGKTDEAGRVSCEPLAAGDYLLEVGDRKTFVPAVSKDLEHLSWALLSPGEYTES